MVRGLRLPRRLPGRKWIDGEPVPVWEDFSSLMMTQNVAYQPSRNLGKSSAGNNEMLIASYWEFLVIKYC